MNLIQKVYVAKGVYWIDIPEADLRVLCGCPADAVKHLMRRGLIVPEERHGVSCETGPNAILLSDIMVQGGGLANLAEFPVLQMLYRQGMILPGHPNNTGRKPLIIGAREQVAVQIAYIYRGNYGLISEQEMIKAGASEEEAREWMRIKLKFAFGRIRPTEDFLDTRMVDEGALEVVPGVALRRIGLNVFEFSFGGESVVVDLNLPPFETYPAPYPLGFHNIRREYFAVIHAGDGDGWDVNRPTMSSVVVFQGRTYLVDAGPNITNTLMSLGIGINELEGIFHTHAHDDHFAGLTTLIRGDKRLKYFATPLVRASVTKKLVALLGFGEEEFGDFFDVRDLRANEWNDVDGLEVMPIPSPHPVETTVFHFRALGEDGYRGYAHFADITALDVLERMVAQSPEDAAGVSPRTVETVRQWYGMRANVKKLDIGGGMIHGKAEDFRDDPSAKVILSHIARPLTRLEKEIGSGAVFGSVDCLIPDFQNYLWRYAYDFLTSYFPQAKPHQIKVLLNNRVEVFNPEAIILKEGQFNQEIFLVLTGNVEMMVGEGGGVNMLYAGSMLGELSCIYQLPSTVTFRAASYVHALRIPDRLYREFVQVNDLYTQIERLQEARDFLQRTWLFGEGISYAVQNRIAQRMRYARLTDGQQVEVDPDSLFLIRKGRLQRTMGEEVMETLTTGDFFGEEVSIFQTPPLCSLQTVEVLEGYWIASDMLRQIPIVRWKLYESHARRMKLALNLEGRGSFGWRSEYEVRVGEMDAHHQRMFAMGEKVRRAFKSGESEVAREAVDFLIHYARFHFEAEEALLRENHYPGYENHRREHQRLMTQVEAMRDHLKSRQYRPDQEFVGFFEDWIVRHILSEDRKYSQFFETPL
ncbi:MAG: bacteriohemerythrin [Magnetococcales bacterium]|nr:bacteriohemerythrin [Magnetococcales bacterium]